MDLEGDPKVFYDRVSAIVRGNTSASLKKQFKMAKGTIANFQSIQASPSAFFPNSFFFRLPSRDMFQGGVLSLCGQNPPKLPLARRLLILSGPPALVAPRISFNAICVFIYFLSSAAYFDTSCLFGHFDMTKICGGHAPTLKESQELGGIRGHLGDIPSTSKESNKSTQTAQRLLPAGIDN